MASDDQHSEKTDSEKKNCNLHLVSSVHRLNFIPTLNVVSSFGQWYPEELQHVTDDEASLRDSVDIPSHKSVRSSANRNGLITSTVKLQPLLVWADAFTAGSGHCCSDPLVGGLMDYNRSIVQEFNNPRVSFCLIPNSNFDLNRSRSQMAIIREHDLWKLEWHYSTLGLLNLQIIDTLFAGFSDFYGFSVG